MDVFQEMFARSAHKWGIAPLLTKGVTFCTQELRNLWFLGSAFTFALLLKQSNLFLCFVSVQSLKAEEQELSSQVINRKC